MSFAPHPVISPEPDSILEGLAVTISLFQKPELELLAVKRRETANVVPLPPVASAANVVVIERDASVLNYFTIVELENAQRSRPSGAVSR